MTEFFAKYDTGGFYDEMFKAPGQARPHYQRLLQRFTETVTKDDKTFYRARFAGFDKDQAEATCKQLRRNDFQCMTMKN